MGEFQRRVELVDVVDEVVELALWVCPDTDTVIDESLEKSWNGARVLCKDLGLYVADKEAGIAGAHACAHSHTAGLYIVLIPEHEGVKC